MAKSETGSARRFLMGAALIVTATIGAMVMANRSSAEDRAKAAADAEAAQAKGSADEEVLIVKPMASSGSISNASWRTQEQADSAAEANEESTSLLGDETDPFGSEQEEADRRRMESLAKTMDEIHGLGVYVASGDDDDATGSDGTDSDVIDPGEEPPSEEDDDEADD